MIEETESEFETIDQLNSPTENALTVFTVFATIAAVVFFAFGKRDESGKEIEPVGVGVTIPDSSPTGTTSQQILLPVSHPLPIDPIEPIPPYPLELSGIESAEQFHDVLAVSESIIFLLDYRLKTLGIAGNNLSDPSEIRDREIVERDVAGLILERIERIEWAGESGETRKEMYLKALSIFFTHP